METFEKLGLFYLGRRHDLAAGKTTDDLVLYDSRDLTTHAVVAGMTGSGKTGLCLTILEEAGLDRIPAVVIDPKGDIANLLLTFPDLTPEAFAPWIDDDQALRAGSTPAEFAAAESERWAAGLQSWGQSAERIRRLRETVELKLYTPGASFGQSLSLLGRFRPPPNPQRDPDALREQIAAATAGLLGLLGIDADPLRSREHILISQLFERAWLAGRELDLPRLIHEVQSPPLERIGVMDLEQFFPQKDRIEFALALNNLLASPTFASWMAGDPLDVARLLHNEQGRPRISIMSIAHLSEPQRMFFVTLLLNEFLAWTTAQAGTTSLRALLYMDEVFGYFPPVANPPSKLPMLRLLKQARAFGVGVILATQNPVDLDYKGLANTGTWFLGRLQTERDKLRVLEGLEGAAVQAGSGFRREDFETALSGLKSRVFLLHNVHESHPVVMETRWAMSYLRGPLTRPQLERLSQLNAAETGATDPISSQSTGAAESGAAVAPDPLPTSAHSDDGDPRASAPASVDQYFAEPNRLPAPPDQLAYRPALLGVARLKYVRKSADVDGHQSRALIVTKHLEEIEGNPWRHAERLDPLPQLQPEPSGEAICESLPEGLRHSDRWLRWQDEFRDYVYREQPLVVWHCRPLRAYSRPEESQGEFRIRLEQLASEQRDEESARVRAKYEPKIQKILEQQARAESRVQQESSEYREKRFDAIVRAGSTILGALLGRRTLSKTNLDKASTSMRTAGRAASERGDVSRAQQHLAAINEKLAAAQADYDEALDQLNEKLSVPQLPLTEIRVPPRKGEIELRQFGIIWLPVRRAPDGTREALGWLPQAESHQP